MRERGLKSRCWSMERNEVPVAPHAGAWIEIPTRRNAPGSSSPSLPMRERGLKFAEDGRDDGNRLALPMRERGLE